MRTGFCSSTRVRSEGRITKKLSLQLLDHKRIFLWYVRGKGCEHTLRMRSWSILPFSLAAFICSVRRAPTTPGRDGDDDVWKPDTDEEAPAWNRAMETANKEWEGQARVRLPLSHRRRPRRRIICSGSLGHFELPSGDGPRQ